MAKKAKSKNEVSQVEGSSKVQKTKVKNKMVTKKKMATVLKNKELQENSIVHCQPISPKQKKTSPSIASSHRNSNTSQIQAKNSQVSGDNLKVPANALQISPSEIPLNNTLSLQNPSCPSSSNETKIIDKRNGNIKASGQDQSGGKHKRKKASKKSHDGISNWASLCSKLNIDPGRKNKPTKAQETTNDEEKLSEPRSKPEVWFDNVDAFLIEGKPSEDKICAPEEKEDSAGDKLVKPDSYKGVTPCVAMDCEMVGVGQRGEESILAKVSIVNHFGACLYDKFVLPRERVTDYRTHVSGVTKENLKTGEEFTKVQKEVNDIIKGKVLIGHALHNDLKVLFLTHPHKMIRDTSNYKPFRQLFQGRIPSLKKLTDKILGVSVQEGQHSSVQDAQAAMRLYTMHRQRWEKELRQLWKQDKKIKKKAKNKQKKKAKL